MARIKVSGLESLQKKLKDNVSLDKVKQTVKLNGSELQGKAQNYAPVGTPESTGIPGYVGGNLKKNIMLDIEDSGLTARVTSTAEYSPYVEYGTRFMEAQPFVGPALNEQKEQFKKDMKKLVR